MVADALVYHPTIAHYLRFVATTGIFPFSSTIRAKLSLQSLSLLMLFSVGRDKLLRMLQYFARFYSWYLFRTNAPSASIQPWDVLKKQFSLIRKGMRVGKNVEHLKAAAATYDAKGMDPVLQYLGVGRQLCYGLYLTLDTATFLDTAGIKKFDGAKRLQQEAYRAWMLGLVFNAVAGCYGLWQLREREQRINKKEGEGVVEAKKLQR